MGGGAGESLSLSHVSAMSVADLACMRKRNLNLIFKLVIGCLALAVTQGVGAPANGRGSDFNREIRPLFAKHCTACHGGVKAAGQLSFIYRDRALATGKSGARAIVPGKP